MIQALKTSVWSGISQLPTAEKTRGTYRTWLRARRNVSASRGSDRASVRTAGRTCYGCHQDRPQQHTDNFNFVTSLLAGLRSFSCYVLWYWDIQQPHPGEERYSAAASYSATRNDHSEALQRLQPLVLISRYPHARFFLSQTAPHMMEA
jgi:hypothetical protein